MQKQIEPATVAVQTEVPVLTVIAKGAGVAIGTAIFALAVAEICMIGGAPFAIVLATTAATTHMLQEATTRTSLYNTDNSNQTVPTSVLKRLMRNLALGFLSFVVAKTAIDITNIPAQHFLRRVMLSTDFLSEKLFPLAFTSSLMTFCGMAIRNNVARRFKASALKQQNG